jgi:hypothetical protein
MDRKIDSASLVLVVCTETYFNRVSGQESVDKGRGVKWEGSIIYQHLYNQGASNLKFIPVLMRNTDKRFIPVPLQGASHFVVDTDTGYEQLYNRILGRPPAEKAPLGKRRAMPRKEVKTDFATYLASPIDVPLWDEAKWRATAFIYGPKVTPILGIAFLNKEPAQRIFEDWRRRYGDRDEYEELRVAIIEGEIAKEHPGYTVHIGLEHEAVFERYKKAGLEVAEEYFFASISRLNRMTPSPTSPHLGMFKAAYAQHGEYLLTPTICKPDGSDLEFAPYFGIRKRAIHFRNAKDIGENDVDSIVLRTGSLNRPLTEYGRSRHK